MIKIQISEKLLVEAFRALYTLTALEHSGVDNWEWYSESIERHEAELREELGDDEFSFSDLNLDDIGYFEDIRFIGE